MKTNRKISSKAIFPASATASAPRRGAFTLVELMVVITIAAIVTGMTLGGYRSLADGNERVSCQTNLTQLYSAIQLYNKDYDGFYPFYDPAGTLAADGSKGLGLWALYAMKTESTPNEPAHLGEKILGTDHDKPFALYVRNRKLLHCPSDKDNEFFTDATDTTKINMNYLSYQVKDGTEMTYQPWRGVADGNWNTKRQLILLKPSPFLYRASRPTEDAVITWCPWHRGRRDMDNVLFVSGAVRPVPKVQANPDYPVATGQPTQPAELTDWNRKPPF